MPLKEKKNSKFSPREIKFLELYFSGALMKTAARVAGYRGSSDQALCNQGRAIINKYEQSPSAKEIFRRAGASEIQIAQLLVDAVHNQSELKRMNSLKILCNCMFSKR